MADLAEFPDVEVAVLDLIADLAAGGTFTPANLSDVLPFVRVQRLGGSDNVITDTARVAIDAFAATRGDARTLAELIRQRLVTPGGHSTADGTLDLATTATAPSEVPWNTQMTVRRFAATYTITARR